MTPEQAPAEGGEQQHGEEHPLRDLGNPGSLSLFYCDNPKAPAALWTSSQATTRLEAHRDGQSQMGQRAGEQNEMMKCCKASAWPSLCVYVREHVLTGLCLFLRECGVWVCL